MSATTAAFPDLYAIPQDLADIRAMVRRLAQERIAPRAGEAAVYEDRYRVYRALYGAVRPAT